MVLKPNDVIIAKCLARGWIKAVLDKGYKDAKGSRISPKEDFAVVRDLAKRHSNSDDAVAKYAARIMAKLADRYQGAPGLNKIAA